MTSIRGYLRQHHVGLLALALIVGGGTAYAAGALPNNSVASPQIKNGSVRSKDVKDRGIKPKDLKPGYAPFAAVDSGPSPGAIITTSATPAKVPGARTVVTMPGPGTIEATFSASTGCSNGSASLTFCRVTLVVDGVAMDGEGNDFFSSTQGGGPSFQNHSTVVRTSRVGRGPHLVEVVWEVVAGAGSSPAFQLYTWNLVAEGHLS